MSVGGGGTYTVLELESTDSSTVRNWQGALNYCRALGNGWRLPSISESKIVRDQTGWGTSAFYWTSSRYYDTTYHGAWIFRPSDSNVNPGNIIGNFRARCVRSVIQ